MRLLYFWCDKYLELENYNCNLAGNMEFSYDVEKGVLSGVSKLVNSNNFFNTLDKDENQIPIEISAIVGRNGVGKTTTLKIISEILSNKGFISKNDYLIKIILVYENKNKKYISYCENMVKRIILDGNELELIQSKKTSEPYVRQPLGLDTKEKNIYKIKDLKSVATLFMSNSYELTIDNDMKSENSINLSNHFLLNSYLKGNSDIYRHTYFLNKFFKPLDFWEMDMLSWDNKFIVSSLFDEVVKDLNLVPAKNINIILDYSCESDNVYSIEKHRLNNSKLDKFSFEKFWDDISNKESTFFEYVYQRICDIIAELILAKNLIDNEKILKVINEIVDYHEYNSITELLKFIANKLEENKELYLNIVVKKDEERLIQSDNKYYDSIIGILREAIKTINRIESIKNKCDFSQEWHEFNYSQRISDSQIIIKTKKLPMLTKKTNISKTHIGGYTFIRELEESIGSFYKMSKILPFYIEANGISAGQRSCLSIFAKLYKFKEMINNKSQVKDIVILFDEVDISLHPEWKRKLVYILTKFLKMLFSKEQCNGIHIIISTNEPYILSDIPKNNTVLLGEKKQEQIVIKKYSEYRTLGANIIDLLDDAFFLSEGNKGQYISEVIKKISTEINGKEINDETIKKYIDIVKLIEEPLIKKSLLQKLNSKLDKDNKANIIAYYKDLIRILEGDEEKDAKDNISRE